MDEVADYIRELRFTAANRVLTRRRDTAVVKFEAAVNRNIRETQKNS